MRNVDITPADWNQIAKDIANFYRKYDAFIILCDKDTLAYTASALSFMLENLTKPVVVTDKDLISAMALVSKTKIPEVMVASKGKLLRACRTIANSTEYFSSPNYAELDKNTAFPFPQEKMQIKYVNPQVKIIVVKLFPGIDQIYMQNILENENIHGIVLEIWASGKTPTDQGFLKAIKALAQKGVVIVAVSQCDEIKENTETDIRLLEAGVLSGHDMTTPAAYAKLAFLLSNVEDKKLIGQLMEISFRGEI